MAEQNLYNAGKMLMAVKKGTELGAVCINMSHGELNEFWRGKYEEHFRASRQQLG